MTVPATLRPTLDSNSSRATGLLLAAAVLTFAQFSAHAQTPPAKPLTYDAISIKPNSGGTSVNNQGMVRSMVMMRNTPDGFNATNVSARSLISSAYDVKDDQISGGPDWIGSKSYDIQAKVTGTDPSDPHQLTKAQRSEGLQALLADRFKLAVHTETKEASIYVLTEGKGAPKLKENKPTDAPPAGIPLGAVVRGPDGGPPPRGGMMRMSGPGNLTVTAMTMAQLANILSQQLHRTVVDKTGLTGSYDFTLQWAPDNLPASPGGEAQAPDPTGPSIFTAVQEQLGLKLESTKGPVKNIVVDHIEPPSDN